jgi:hypothetical protein
MEAVIIRRNREAYSVVQFKLTSAALLTTIGPILYLFCILNIYRAVKFIL